jgi:hypothetical protein
MAGAHNGEFSPEFQSEYLGEEESGIGAAHEGEFEDEMESALQGEGEIHEQSHEYEFGEQSAEFNPEVGSNGEEFLGKRFKKLSRGIGGFVKKAAPLLKGVARVAAPMLIRAVGGPLGGMLAGPAGSLLQSALGEEEQGAYEDEYGLQEDELSLGEEEGGTFEDEFGLQDTESPSYEGLPELQNEAYPEAQPEGPALEVLAEQLAEVAAFAQTEAEAEAMSGAAVMTVLSPRDRATLRQLLPHLIRGTALLTRLLRQRRMTRPAVRAVPTIMRQTVRTLRQRAAAGRPVSRKLAGQVLAAQTRRILSSPRACARVIARNVQASAKVRPVRG